MLPAQVVDVVLTGGLETQTARRLVVRGKLLDLENARFVDGTVERRVGTLELPDTPTAPEAVATAGGEAVVWNSGRLHVRDTYGWQARGELGDGNPLVAEKVQAVRRAREQEQVSCDRYGARVVVAWTEQGDSGAWEVRLVVLDRNTGTRYLDGVLLRTAAQPYRPMVRVVSVSQGVVVLYADGATLYGRSVTGLLGGNPTLSAEASLRTDFSQMAGVTVPGWLDAGSFYGGSWATVVYTHGAAGTGITVGALGITFPTNLPTWAPGGGAPATQTVATGPVEGLRVGAFGTGGVPPATPMFLVYRVRATAALEMRPVAGTNIPGAAVSLGSYGAAGGSALDKVALFHQQASLAATVVWEPTGASTQWVRFTAAGVTQALAVWVRGIRLAGDAFALGGRALVPVVYVPNFGNVANNPDGTQPTAFLLDLDTRAVVARGLDSVSGRPRGHTLPTPLVQPSDGRVEVPFPERGRLAFGSAGAGTTYDATPLGVSLLVVRRAAPAQLARLEEEDTLHVGGACPLYYDGAALVEDGFHVYPEGLTAAVNGSSGGGLSVGTYRWRAVYEWTDARGRLNRSAPSPEVVLAVGVAGQHVDVRIPYLHLTRREGVRLVLYRTKANGTLFQRVTPPTSPYVNAPNGAADTLTINDSTMDVNLDAAEVLYTTGRVLPYLPPPGHRFLHRHRGFLFAGGLEDPHAYAYSLPLVEGEAPAWSDVLTNRVPTDTGRVTGFGTVDRLLVVFTERGAYVVDGDGPAATGADGSFTDPEPATGAPGCLDWRTVAPVPEGIIYKAPEGFRLLNRGMAAEPIGSGVHRFNALEVVRAVVVPGADEVRWYTTEGRTLVWSTRWGQWSTDTLQPAVDAAVVGGVVWRAEPERIVYEDAATRREAGQSVPWRVGTSWLSFGSVQGVQRVRRVLLLGKLEAPALLSVLAYFDGEEDTAGVELERDLPGGGKLQLRHHLPRQKCQAIRLVWTFTPTGGDDSEDYGSLGLTALSFEVGIRSGAAKVGGARNL